MRREENPWSAAVVMICTKCHKGISSSLLKEDGNSADSLKMYLKKAFKETGDLDKIRIVTSSCLNVCIEDRMALALAKTNGETETYTVHPEKDRTVLLQTLREKIKS